MSAKVVFFESDNKFGVVAFVPGEQEPRVALELPAVYKSAREASIAWGELRFTMCHGKPTDISGFDRDLVALVQRGEVVVGG